jgi:rSAM/selenodomain-associated transferase 1
MDDRVALFVRAPVAGQVKSRLARSIGAEQALAAHKTLALHALNNLSGAKDFTLEIWGSQSHPVINEWCARFHLAGQLQCPGDLGKRMRDALRRLCSEGGKGIVIGSDCPSIDRAYIRLALAALDDADLVLGPAEDGGYGLIGWRGTQVADVFTGVEWGSSHVLEQTLALASANGLIVKELPTVWDVDEIEDWQRFQTSF